ncbi:hypothetical protein [Saccharothrix lopnurensis]|uniref:Uncharacterized protein n=1 Tax=Saccharothrix lopnurensis TaxID=1670621 RepID=A0ABW1P470_9PSEU
MSPETPSNDAADQLRPAVPEAEDADLDEEAAVGHDATPADVLEADPADVADQLRAVPLTEDPADPNNS